jgi:hypothetical protein
MEMYNNKFVMTVIVDGQIQKELANGQVNLPLKTEYIIRLRNKHNRRAICKLYIDGENVSGGGFIIPANSCIDVERPVDVAKKFKFVSLDSEEAHDYGKNGDNIDKIKGTIVADFALEKHWTISSHVTYRYPTVPCYVNHSIQPRYKRLSEGYLDLDSFSENPAKCFETPPLFGSSALKDGATVEGDYSSQRFSSVYFSPEDNWTKIRLFLQGYEPQIKIANAEINNLKMENFSKDEELFRLEKELLELQKLKTKREIEKLKAELA